MRPQTKSWFRKFPKKNKWKTVNMYECGRKKERKHKVRTSYNNAFHQQIHINITCTSPPPLQNISSRREKTICLKPEKSTKKISTEQFICIWWDRHIGIGEIALKKCTVHKTTFIHTHTPKHTNVCTQVYFS